MTFKSSKLIHSERWLGTLALCFAFTAASAQQPPAAAANQTPAPAGYVRFWNMLTAKGSPSLQLLSSETSLLTVAAPSNSGSNYVSLPPATYTFIVRKVGDTVNPLKKVAVVLRVGTYITFLVSEKGGQPTVELLDDTQDPKKADAPSRLVVRQFMPAAKVTVATREGATSQEVGFGETTTLENLPNRNVFLTMKATGLGPEVAVWHTDADFSTSRHATLLIVGDAYGRFRPRLSYDGQSSAVADPTPPPSPKP